MKDKIIIFIVGLLLGAIISTASIYFYTVAENSNNGQPMQGGNPPSGQMNGESGPPEMPNGMTPPDNN